MKARVALTLAAVCIALATIAAQEQRPTFSSRVELLTVDVSALAEDGTPVEGLTPADFVVRIDGTSRPVVSAGFLRLDTGPADTMAPRRISDNREPSGGSGRFVMIVVDDASFLPGDERAPIAAVTRFVDALGPNDRVGLSLTSTGALAMPSTDRETLKRALARIAGGWDIKPEVASGTYMGLAEAMDIALGNRNAFVQAVARICQRQISSGDVATGDPCVEEVETSAQRTLDNIRQNAMTRTSNIAGLMRTLASVEGQKTLVLVSAGLMIPGDLEPVQQIAALAPAANATLHTIYVDNSFAGDVRNQAPQTRRGADVSASMNGLDTLAGMSRGTFQRLVGGGEGIFDRLAREMSAVYRLGVEAAATDFDGNPHRLEVRVSRPNTIVRAHRSVVATRAAAAGDAAARLARAIKLSEPLREMPARLTHFVFPGDEGRVRVVLAGEVMPPAAGPVAVMYHVLDAQGRIVDSRLAPVMGDDNRAAHTPVMIHADLQLSPGSYAAKLAAIDGGGAMGAVQHAFTASLTGVGSLALGDVTFFPGNEAAMLAPRDRLSADAGSFIAYVEVGGTPDESAVVTLELVDAAGGTVMSNDVTLSFDGTPPKAGVRSEFAVTDVPAGDYSIDASLWIGDQMLGKVSTPVTIERAGDAPPARAASLERTGAASARPVLSGLEGLIAPQFDHRQLLSDDLAVLVSQQVQARGSGEAGRAFAEGLREFEAGRAEEAAVQFRAALAADPEFAPALFYLAACYALGGRDDEAAAAWQTSLGSAPATPMVYVQLADALMRLRRPDEARVFVEEGLGKFPGDVDLRLRAMIGSAASGLDVDADELTALVGERPELLEARLLLVAVLRDRWNVAGPGEKDAIKKALRSHAARYVDAGGPYAAIVRRWLAGVR